MTTYENSVLRDHPNPHANVFLMMRFRKNLQYPAIVEAIRRPLDYYGLRLLRSDDKAYHHSLWENVRAYMEACAHGVTVFEQIYDQDINPNISIELGYMLAKGYPCLVLKERRSRLPTDLIGHLYKPFDSDDISGTIEPCITEWLRDIRIAKTPGVKHVLYVSTYGTCRCAMAKVVTEQTLQWRKPRFGLRILSVGNRYYQGLDRASNGARKAVSDSYGFEHLKEHQVTTQSLGLLRDADLILTMTEEIRQDILKQDIPTEGVRNFNEFFGLDGDIPDPYRLDDQYAEKEETRQGYQECLAQFRKTIEPRVSKLLEFLDK